MPGSASSSKEKTLYVVLNYIFIVLTLVLAVLGFLTTAGVDTATIILKGLFLSMVFLSIFWLITGGKAKVKGKLNITPKKVKGEIFGFLVGELSWQYLVVVLICAGLGFGIQAILWFISEDLVRNAVFTL
jgi:uncharacterized membrane protein YtjA (UPF0391 family)